jgi:7-cyano-7-deazaguanine synthase
MEKVVIGLSGGMDSTTLLGFLLEQGFSVHCISFTYGSKHNKYEQVAVKNIIEYYLRGGFKVTFSHIDLFEQFYLIKSNLLLSGGDIPEGHYNEPTMKLTVVPGRNLIISSFLAAIAESTNAQSIALGVHSGDHFIYPDCRPEFINSLQQTLFYSTEGKVKIITPFTELNKADILKIGYSLKTIIPYHLTRTCYKDQEISCGKCGSCVERLEAFSLINKKDPINYEV